jgi:hypothetical protein
MSLSLWKRKTIRALVLCAADRTLTSSDVLLVEYSITLSFSPLHGLDHKTSERLAATS